MLIAEHTMTDLYFRTLTSALHDAGVCTPVMVIDRERLDHNIDHLIDVMNRGFDYRIVAKSLPSVPLLQYIMRRTGTTRLMCFHLPFLMHLIEHIPAADILLGKPMPVCAARHFYAWHGQQTSSMCFAPELQLQWLIDSPQRLQQYEQLAQELNVRMRVSLEIDVGLHRGGFQPGEDFMAALERVSRSPWLSLSGLMGYEAHIGKIPALLGGPTAAFNATRQRYAACVQQVRDVLGEAVLKTLCLNTGGSTTYPLYDADSLGIVSEISVGSALLKPTDFDVETLEHHLPAAYIAAPVLKRVQQPEIPEAPRLSRALRAIGLLPKQGCYLYGGNWLASPCYPAEARLSSLLGRSSNQEFYQLPADTRLQQDDYVFFQPTQSEALLLQFGQLAVVEQGRICDWWPVFSYPDTFPQYRLQRARQPQPCASTLMQPD
ncbi:type III pyridoxal 5-phosphate-dependent enzyme [Venatoribacter cucullus]|nr:type III pyridoxal 5-phosphate-dependent enzyme [Venatoribacter cucullus]